MSLSRLEKIQLLLVVLAFSAAFAHKAQSESFGGAAAEALLQTQEPEPRAAAKAHRSPRAATPHAAQHKTIAPQAKSSNDAGHTAGKTAGKNSVKNSGKNSINKPEKASWSAAGATNLDAIKDMGPMAGLLIMGPSFDVGNAGTLMNGASQAGIGSAALWGVVAAVASVVLMMLMASMQKNIGARPGSTQNSNHLSPVAAVAVFIIVFCVKLFVFPDHPVNLESADELQLLPVYSNEFGLHCFLPKEPLKAKFTEKVSTNDITVTVAGYRRGKNEMMIGYAHMPTLEQMVKAKEAESPGFATMAQMQQSFGVKLPSAARTRYYFDVNKALDACVDAAGKRANFKVSYRCPIVVNGKLPGREYEATASHDRLVRGRVFMGYDNYYHAIVVGDQSFVNSNDAYKFLDSLDVH